VPAGIFAIGRTVAGAELAGEAADQLAAGPAEADPSEAGPQAEVSSSPAAARDMRAQTRAGIIWFSSIVLRLDRPCWLTNILIIETAKGQMPWHNRVKASGKASRCVIRFEVGENCGE
jgi:hypothetical protein